MTVNLAFVFLLFLGVTQASRYPEICGGENAALCDFVPRARDRAIKWLLKENGAFTTPGQQFTLDQLTALFSVQLADPAFLAELEPQVRRIFQSDLESTMLSALASARANQRKGDIVPYLDPVLFAQQLLTMEASCIDTRNFYGQDLQYHLSILTRDFPEANYGKLFQFAFSILPLCSTNFELYEKVWLKLLRVRDTNRPCMIVPRDEFEGTDREHQAFTIATLSMLVMAQRCARNQVPEKHREVFFQRFYQRARCIAGWQNQTNYGFGGDVKTTALAVQALYAANMDPTAWNCTGAVHHLLRAQKLEGSFSWGTSAETSLALQVLATSHMGGLWEADIECPEGRERHMLPRQIGPFDTRNTFTLVIYNMITNTHWFQNITIIDGENLLQALIRAKLDENTDFVFTAERFSFRGKEGVFLTSVYGVANDRQRSYHWFVKKPSEDGEGFEDEFFTLDRLRPEDGSKIILTYVDVTPEDQRPPQLPRAITKDDDYFNVTIKVTNEITGTEDVYFAPIIKGEPLLAALLRAWKNPWSDFKAEAAQIFNKNGVFLKSVNGVGPDHENFYFWVVKSWGEDDGKKETIDGRDFFKPIGLLEYRPIEEYPVNIAYVDLSAYKDQINPSGKGLRQLPKEIEDGDSTVDFTLVMFNEISKRKWAYNLTILEGETLFDAFLRGWKDTEMFPRFGFNVFPFFGKQSLYLTSVNELANSHANLSFWIVLGNVKPEEMREDRDFQPLGLTEVYPENGGQVHVVYKNLTPWRQQLFMSLDGEVQMGPQMMGAASSEMIEQVQTPREIRDCDTLLNITIYVVNNITQTKESFNLTIIEGDYLYEALDRAWKDPEIDFTYTWDIFTAFNKPGVYPLSVNGLATNAEEYTSWIVKLADEDDSMMGIFGSLDLLFVPRNWDKIVFLYADLSPWKEELEQAKAELPPSIEEDNETVTFTLYVINELRHEHSGYNVTILEGETLLDGLHRVWKNRSNTFNFGAAPFEFLGVNGVFLTSVDGVANSKLDLYHWVVKTPMTEEFNAITYRPTALNKLKPMDGSVVKLVYTDISDIIEERRRHDARGEFPRLLRRSDDVFTLSIVVLNNITQEHSLYNVEVIKGENLAHALLRAWKDPYTDFNFAAQTFSLFGKPGVYLRSVNGVANNQSQFYYWLVKDFPKCEMGMDEAEESHGPFGLTDYIPNPKKVVKLVYADLSQYKDKVTTTGEGRRELPEMIEDDDDTISFTINIYNSETGRRWTYNMTILKGESLFEAFLRMWKKPDVGIDDFTVRPFEFFGNAGIYLTAINHISNDQETGYHWLVKPERGEDWLESVGLTQFIPKDGSQVHIAYVNLREMFERRRVGRGQIMPLGEEAEFPGKILPCDSTANVTIYVVNNITQEKESFNLTVIEGEKLGFALLRAWRNPEIDFNFATAPFVFFFKAGLYLTSVNGLANSKENFMFWLVKKPNEEGEEDEEVAGPIGLEDLTLWNGDKIILLYADLSPFKEKLQVGLSELPRPITEDDTTVTFTLYTIDTWRQQHKGYNITILEGETILDGLKRAWKSWESYFNFAVAPFRFISRSGMFITSVNGVRNSRRTGYHWLLLDGDTDPSRKIPPAEFEPIGLTEVMPTDGSVFKLAYVDLTQIFSRKQAKDEFPRPIHDDDDTFVLNILVGNNMTGEHSSYNVTILEGESLLYGLLRAWKDPWSDFSFAANVFKFFDKEDYFLTSVLGVANDLDKNYYWIVVDGEHEPDQMDSNYQPIGLLNYVPREGVPVKLIYADLSPWKHDLNPTGEGRHQLPKEIEEGAATVNFKLNVFNSILQRNWHYKVTILEGENLLDALLRLWKDPEVDFNFGAAAFKFADKFGFYVININGLINQPENYFFWIVLGEVDPKDNSEDPSAFNPLGLREVVPTNGSEVHIVYKDLCPYAYLFSQAGMWSQESQGMMMMGRESQEMMVMGRESQGMMVMGRESQEMMMMGRERKPEEYGLLPREIEEDDWTLNISIHVVNNITQTQKGFNVTIIWGESLFEALLRAWKDPEIDFNFAAKLYTIFDKYELYLSSVDGVANNFTNFYYWMIHRAGEGNGTNFEPMGLFGIIPKPDEKIVLSYVDLSQHRDKLSPRQLPRNIQDGEETVNFNLFVVNNITKEHCSYNMSILPGEDLLDTLYRLWKDPEQYFSFSTAAFRFFGKFGVYLQSVNGLRNNPELLFHWVAEIARTPEEKMMMMTMNSSGVMEYRPWGLVEFIPMDGTDVKLIYIDLTPWIPGSQGDRNWA